MEGYPAPSRATAEARMTTKQSGIGREFDIYGIRSYLEAQAVFSPAPAPVAA
jgi:hypothetical protein